MAERSTPAQTIGQRREAALDRVVHDGRKVDGAYSKRRVDVLKHMDRVDSGTNRLKPKHPERGLRTHGSQEKQTRQRRLMGGAAVVLLAAAGAVGGPKMLENGQDGAESDPVIEKVVEPGDTLWSLTRAEADASGIDPETDIRQWVDQAVEMNGGPNVQAGQTVEIPNIPSPQAPQG